MPIKPGKCPTVGGVPNCPPFTEKDIIKVTKVFDQCITTDIVTRSECYDKNKKVIVTDVGDGFCKVLSTTPTSEPYYTTVELLQVLPITVSVDSSPKAVNLETVTSIVLWVPPGTEEGIQCEILSHSVVHVKVVGTCSEKGTDGEKLYQFWAEVCKEIQVKKDVKLLIPSYGYPEFGPCDPGKPIPCPPDGRPFPAQRCQKTPVVTVQLNGGGLQGVEVSIERKIDLSTTVIKQTTDSSGNAVFTGIGGFVGAADRISFTDPGGVKYVELDLPLEFTGADGNLHDSATACTIVFNRIQTTPVPIYQVTIDGILMANTIDPS